MSKRCDEDVSLEPPWPQCARHAGQMPESGLHLQREYKHHGGDLNVTADMKQDFQKYGYFIVRSLLSEKELAKLKLSLEKTEEIETSTFSVKDDDKGVMRMCLWNHPGHDVPGMLARSQKVAGTCEELLGGEVYHYHTKLMRKEAFTGGKFVWHQDYGYWYNNGCLFPDMMTAFIAMDPCTKENGCLQVLSGSHACGRIEHEQAGNQYRADLERVQQLETKCPKVFVELQPGDALFFHCNLLHTSSANTSPHRRWAFLIAYNRATNDPVREHHHPCYTKLNKVPNSAILECEKLWDEEDKDMMSKRLNERPDLVFEK